MDKNMECVNDSAAKHISFRGEHKENVLRQYFKLPNIGGIILYNEIESYHSHSGKPRTLRRGVGYVVGYNGGNMLIKQLMRPTYTFNECFRMRDFQHGLFQYVYLREVIYVGSGEGYTWSDLDIRNPHADLAALICPEISFNQESINIKKFSNKSNY